MRTRIAHTTTVVAVALTSVGLLAGTSSTGAGATLAGIHSTRRTSVATVARPGVADHARRGRIEILHTDDEPVAPPPVPVTDATSVWTPDWQCIRIHESGDQYNSAAAPSGAYGIIQETWQSFGYGGWPYQAAAATQNQVALELYNRYGWSPWSTRFACGL
jgi:hypothetical protein